MGILVRCGTLAALLLCGACGTKSPTQPSAMQTPMSSTPPPSPSPSGPPLTGQVTVYAFSEPLNYPVRSYTPGSRFVLYESGAFGLHYEGIAHVYTGSYLLEDGRIIFDFLADGQNSFTGQLEAVGTLKGTALEIRYSDELQHSDFENAVYRRAE